MCRRLLELLSKSDSRLIRMHKIIFTPSPEDKARALASAEDLGLAREGKITKTEYDRRERKRILEVRAELNVAHGLPAGHVSPEEIEWKRIQAKRREKAKAKRKRER
jgi:hypothetical protein